MKAIRTHEPTGVSGLGGDREGRVAGGVMVEHGEHALPVIRDLLGRPDVALVHLRNVGYGCYNLAVRYRFPGLAQSLAGLLPSKWPGPTPRLPR